MTEKTDSRENAHTIFVGGKPFMNYVTAVVMQFTVKNAERVVVRSRGKFISRAVDIAEVVRNRFLKDQLSIQNIQIGSEEFKNKDGQMVNVSTLDIALEKVAEGPIKTTLNIGGQANGVAAEPVETPGPIESPHISEPDITQAE